LRNADCGLKTEASVFIIRNPNPNPNLEIHNPKSAFRNNKDGSGSWLSTGAVQDYFAARARRDGEGFLAEDTKLERTVALKVLPEDVSQINSG